MKHIITPLLNRVLVKVPTPPKSSLIKTDAIIKAEKGSIKKDTLEVIACGPRVAGIVPGDKVCLASELTNLEILPFNTGDETYEFAFIQDYQITGVVVEVPTDENIN